MSWKKKIFYKFWIFLLIVNVSLIAGCASMSRFKEYEVEKVKQVEINKSYGKKRYKLECGEKLHYEVFWTGIPAGKVTLEIKDITTFKGSKVYKLVGKANTNKFFSVMYNVKDIFRSYMDKEKKVSKGYELIRKGKDRKKEKVVFDYKNHKAIIRSEDGKKEKELSKEIQDPLSSLYCFRKQSIKTGDKIIMDVQVEKKNWQVEYNIKKFGKFNLVNLGVFNAFLVKPIIKRNGKIRKDRIIKFWISADERRLPLVVNIDVPIGYMKAVLRKVES